MTDEERAALADVKDKVDLLHKALMEEPATGGAPLIVRIGRVVDFAEHSSWAGKWGVRIVLGLGAMFVAAANIKTGIGK